MSLWGPLPYKQRVGGSTPSTPTKRKSTTDKGFRFFVGPDILCKFLKRSHIRSHFLIAFALRQFNLKTAVKMITTYNGCYRSEIKVTPKNWHTTKASVIRKWRIHYRFYDPAFKDYPKYKKGKQVPIKGMNHVNMLEERQAITKNLIEKELFDIDVRGYNPITKAFMAPSVDDAEAKEITQKTMLSLALQMALPQCEMEPDTVTDCKSVLKYFMQSASLLKKDKTPLNDVKSRDIIAILNNCKNLTVTTVINKKVLVDGKWEVEKVMQGGKLVPIKTEVTKQKVWTDNQFNHYRKYLHILFSKIKKLEILEYNPVDNVDRRDTTPEDPDLAKRKVLTTEERRKVHIELITKFPTFHRLIHIFYHSGARRKEIMRIQGKNVDLAGQRFKVLIKKRKKWTWTWKTIKDVALPYWVEAMDGCGSEDFVFSRGLLPGPKAIRPEQFTRRWREHVKKKMGIQSRMYDLKHLHTTETINELEKLKSELSDAVQLAADHNSHTSPAMVVKIYDVDADKREHKKVKGLKNSFAG
jgi:integrase